MDEYSDNQKNVNSDMQYQSHVIPPNKKLLFRWLGSGDWRGCRSSVFLQFLSPLSSFYHIGWHFQDLYSSMRWRHNTSCSDFFVVTTLQKGTQNARLWPMQISKESLISRKDFFKWKLFAAVLQNRFDSATDFIGQWYSIFKYFAKKMR